jgi:hypothetical protein
MARRKGKTTDVVIPHGDGSFWQCNELRYSLRSIEKNFTNLGNVWIVGHKPKWLKNVNFIKMKDGQNRGANIINKIMRCCEEERLTAEFVRMSDDQYFLKKVNKIDSYYTYDMEGVRFDLRGKRKEWFMRLNNARRYLRKRGHTAYNYETHFPMLVNKFRFIEIMGGVDYESALYPTNSIYFNIANLTHKKTPDWMAKFYKEDVPMSEIAGKTFLGHDDLGLSYALQDKLKELFPDKSGFEK